MESKQRGRSMPRRSSTRRSRENDRGYRRADVIFTQGNPVRASYIKRVVISVLEDWERGGRGDAGPRRLLWRRMPGGSTRPHGERDRDPGSTILFVDKG
jgi:hypothetical protein